MTSVFISYSRRDKGIADYITAELRNRGAEVFIDYQKLVAGENFIGRIGSEIAKKDAVILLFSPNSANSKWVQWEIAWALNCDKKVIPLILEPAPIENFFFLAGTEQIDVTNWKLDGQIHEGIKRLSLSLGLPDQQIYDDRLPELLVQHSIVELEELQENEPSVTYNDLAELNKKALECQESDPEAAFFLYQQILEIDPNYDDGKAKRYIQNIQKRLKQARIHNLKAKTQTAIKEGKYSLAEQFCRSLLELDKKDLEAKKWLEQCRENSTCETVYQVAAEASKEGRKTVAINAMKGIQEQCPNFGDPLHILRGCPIESDFLDYIRKIHTIQGHDKQVYSIAFSPDSKILASASGDKTIRLWSMDTWQQIAKLEGHFSAVYSVAFSPNGKYLASCSNDHTVKLWDVQKYNNLTQHQEHEGFVSCVKFSPDGNMLASASSDQTIILWNLTTGQQFPKLIGHQDIVRCMAFSPDGTKMISGADDGEIILWDIKNARKLDVKEYKRPISSISYSPDGIKIAVFVFDGDQFYFLNSENLKPDDSSNTFIHQRGYFRGSETKTDEHIYSNNFDSQAIDFSSRGDLLSISSYGRDFMIINLTRKNYGYYESKTLDTFSKGAIFSPDGSLIASISAKGKVDIYGL